jgi:hypothetical protein
MLNWNLNKTEMWSGSLEFRYKQVIKLIAVANSDLWSTTQNAAGYYSSYLTIQTQRFFFHHAELKSKMVKSRLIWGSHSLCQDPV